MATTPLSKVRFMGTRERYGFFMQELQKRGDAHLVDLSHIEGSEKASLPSLNKAKTDFLLDFLLPVAPKASMLKGEWVQLTKKESRDRAAGFAPKLDEVYAKAEEVQQVLVSADHEIKNLETKKAPFAGFVGLPVPIGQEKVETEAHVHVASMAASSWDSFLQELSEGTPLYDVLWSSASKTEVCFAIMHHQEAEEVVHAALQNAGAAEPSWWKDQALAGKMAEEVVAELSGEIEKQKTALATANAEHKALAEHYEDLKVFADYANWESEVGVASEKGFMSESVFAVDAWVPTENLKDIQTWTKNYFVGDVFVSEEPAEENEAVPVKAHNNAMIRPYEMLTNMYGSPKSSDIDPTPSLSPFFLVFFGICLSDVGYGLLLFVSSLIFLLFGTLSREQKDMYSLIFMCGISAMIGGVLLGGYFGMTAEQLPEFMVNADGSIKGALIDPVAGQGPIRFLVFSLAIGLFQLISGIVVQFYRHIKFKDYDKAFFESVPWFVFLITGITYALAAAGQVNLPTGLLSKATMITAGILVLCLGRKASWAMKIPSGILGLYGVMDYVSDTLSYSRLMALGLATGVIAFSMNTTAGVLFDMIGIPVVSHLVAAVVLVFGHTLNFGLSLLGASIHSMRLQFIEFFKRFYEGGGQAFEPFARRARYILFRS